MPWYSVTNFALTVLICPNHGYILAFVLRREMNFDTWFQFVNIKFIFDNKTNNPIKNALVL